jgi:purine-binding chemotaxis protein CheW
VTSGRRAVPAAGSADGRREAILRERARELAQARDAESSGTVSLLPFEVGGERYAVEVTSVHQVLDARAIDPLLGAPRGVLGAVMSRGRPAPVFDLRSLLGLEGGGLSDLVRVVLVDDGGDVYGFAVERVAARVEVAVTDLTPADAGPFRWLGPDQLAVLDPSRLGVAGREAA